MLSYYDDAKQKQIGQIAFSNLPNVSFDNLMKIWEKMYNKTILMES